MTPDKAAVFTELVAAPEERIDLGRAALAIALQHYPDLDIDAQVARLDHMADACRDRVGPNCAPSGLMREMNRYLFQELGFRGDLETFNDPRNSFLNDVLDRRKGIPITLSVIYMEVARRLGLSVRGVSFPGHFLMKVAFGRRELVIDAFAGGRLLNRRELDRRLDHFSERQRSAWSMDELLRPADKREILARMLRNLKTIYLYTEDYFNALACVNLILAISPESPFEIRDRAYLHDHLECMHAAIRDYEQYLLLSPDSTDTPHVRTRLADLRHTVGHLH